MIDIGFTGTRHGMTDAQKQSLQWLLAGYRRPAWLHHGLCDGADAQAHEIALAMDMQIEGHPPTDTRLMAHLEGFAKLRDPLPYLKRNAEIVQASSDVIGAPFEGRPSTGGTWSTIRYARSLGRRVTIILPDGRMERYAGGVEVAPSVVTRELKIRRLIEGYRT